MNTQTASEQNTNHKENNNTSNEEFRGYYRQKKIRLFVDNIHKSSTFGGLLEFLKDKNKLHPSGIKLFRSKRSGHQAAKIHLYPEEADKVLSNEFMWPQGITCDRWLSHDEANKKLNKQQINEKQTDFRGYEKSDENSSRHNRDNDNYRYDKTQNRRTYRKTNNRNARRQTYNRDDEEYSKNYNSYYEDSTIDNYNHGHSKDSYNTHDQYDNDY